jgi:hypothetical protein
MIPATPRPAASLEGPPTLPGHSAPKASPSAAPTRRPAAWWLTLALALLVNLALLLAYHDRSWYPPDEGNYATVAERLLDGEVLHRDVQDVHAGYVNFVNAAAFAAFGRRLLSLRYPLAAAALVQALVVFLLLARRGPWLAAIGSVAATALSVLQFLNPTAHWYSLLLFFVTALLLDRLGDRQGAAAGRDDVILGLAVGLTFGFRQLTGVLVALGVVSHRLLAAGAREPAGGRPALLARLTLGTLAAGLAAYLATATNLTGFGLFGLWPLALLLLAQARPLPTNPVVGRTLLRLAAGGLAAVLPLFLYHLAHGSLAAWYGDAFAAAGSLPKLPFIRQVDIASNLLAGGLAGAFRHESAAAVANGLYWAVLPLAASALGLALVLRFLPRRGAFRPAPAPLPWLAAFYAVVTVHFQNSTYLFFGLAGTVAGLLWVAAEAERWWRRGAMASVALAAAVAVHYHAGQSVNRGDLGLLAGERLAVTEAAGIPRCGLRIDPRDLADYRAALALIEREAAPGEAIFALPSNAELYFLSGRKNPFRFFNFALGVRSEAEARTLLAAIARRPPRLVFYDGLDKYNTPLSRWTMANLARRYELVGAVGRWDVFRLPRAGAGPAASGAGAPGPPPPRGAVGAPDRGD